jgi:NAD+ kinase
MRYNEAMTFRSIALTARSDFEHKEETLERIVRIVEGLGIDVCIDPDRCAVPILKRCKHFKELKGFDLIIVVGGDGTILRTVRDLKDFSIPLLTINRGTVGFLTESGTDDLETIIPTLLRAETAVEERQMLSCSVKRGDKEIIQGHVLNEIVMSQGAIARIIQLETTINDQHLATFRSDGVIIATPTGSTAYNLSAGGPIVHPRSRETIITPINAHAITQKPLVVPADEVITVTVLPRESKFEHVEVSLTLDGQTHHKLQRGDRVTVTEHPERVRFLRQQKDTFYKTLRGKLGWGE